MVGKLDLDSVCRAYGYRIDKLIQYNERKGRYCWRLYREEKTFFLKYNDPKEEYLKYSNDLLKEGGVYKALKETGIMPRLEEIIDHGYISEWIEGASTIRDFIISEANDNIIYNAVTDLILKWKQFSQKLDESDLIIENSPQMGKRYLGVLGFSGPFGTSGRIKKIDRIKIQLCMYLLYPSLRRKLRKNCTLKVCHGDFHMNNIVADLSGKCRIIDAENVGRFYCEAELAFFISQLKKVLKEKHILLKRIELFVEMELNGFINVFVYLKILKLYYYVISFNPRF